VVRIEGSLALQYGAGHSQQLIADCSQRAPVAVAAFGYHMAKRAILGSLAEAAHASKR